MQKTDSATMNVIGSVIIQPHTLDAVHIGIYEDVIPAPKLSVKVEPDVGELLCSTLETKKDKGEYTLVYFFQNYSDDECQVTVLAEG